MAEKKKKPTVDSRVKDIESYLDQLLTSMDTLLDRTENIEVELQKLKLHQESLEAQVDTAKARIGLVG
tara:strand:+ start:1026 stop:1229 length:204 start_codon:yes stop_codon:yes gene_type:complete